MAKFWEFFENLGEYVYVADPVTYELVYMNKKLREMCGLTGSENISGRKCHELLQNCSTPCAMCNNSELQPGVFREWWYYNSVWDKNLSIKDTLVEEDGRQYRLEISIDVSPIERHTNAVQNHPNLEALANETLRVALKKSDPEESITVVLEYLGKLLNGERTYIFEKKENGNDANTYEWVAAGVEAQKDTLQDLPPEVCANWYQNFSEDRHIVVDEVEKLRESDPLMYKTLKRQDIRSLVVVPLYDNKQVIGFYGVDNPSGKYLDQASDILQMMAHFIVASIKRRDLILRLQQEEADRTAAAYQKEITEALEQNKALAARAQENLDMVNAIIGSGLWYMEFDESGEMTHVFWSQEFRRMLGFVDSADFPDLLESWSDRLHPDDKDATMEAFWNCVAGKGEYDVKHRLMRQDGEYEWFHTVGRTARYANGQARLFLGTFVNITKDLKARQALEEAYQAANRANAAKTDFLSSITHDIRTPLNGIIGMTAIAAANIANPEKVRRCLSEITVSSRHLLALVNEVLDMNKIESGKISLNDEAFNLADLIDNFVSISKPLIAAKHHEFTANIHTIEHENVVGDCDRLQQCLMNFMSNAVKYTPEGGTIRLSISEKPTNRPKIGCYEFIFEDNGIGMSEEFIPTIFQPFARAKDERASRQQGTGLGMPITKNIIQMMNGDIKVESRLNGGTRFTATIFLELQDADEVLRDEALLNLPVLVADDDQVACESTCFVLDELGMCGEWVLSGKEAVARVTERHGEGKDYFAVILDWKMPEMDGLDTARAIREKVGDDIPIIIISAYDWTEIEEEARAVGVNAFIAKPIFKSRVAHLFRELTGKENSEAERTAFASLSQYREKDFSGRRVLLVEDNELNTEIASEILGMTGMDIDHAWNGREAVEMLKRAEDGYYDIVFMDVQMPVMDGYEAARAIRSEERAYLRQVPIIAMTANAFAEDVRAAKAAGMDEHVAKPLDFDRLMEVLGKWLAFKEA